LDGQTVQGDPARERAGQLVGLDRRAHRIESRRVGARPSPATVSGVPGTGAARAPRPPARGAVWGAAARSWWSGPGRRGRARRWAARPTAWWPAARWPAESSAAGAGEEA